MALKTIVYLTESEYATLKSTGSVEIPANSGNIYTPSAETEFRKIVEIPKKYYAHKVDYNGADGHFSLQFLSTKSSAISNTEFFTEQFAAGFLNGWAYGEDSQIYVVTSVVYTPDSPNNFVSFISGEINLRDYSSFQEPIYDTVTEL